MLRAMRVGHMASRSETSAAMKCERGRVSKIRARLSTRNDESYTVHAVGARESRMREQEVSGKKVGHRTRPGPVLTSHYSTSTKHVLTTSTKHVLTRPVHNTGRDQTCSRSVQQSE